MTRILVVDDDDDVRDALSAVLEDDGYEVVAACGARAALASLAGGPHPDLMLLDYMMPEMDGVELRSLLLADPRLSGIPVVFLTADARLRERVQELRAAAVLTKPVRLTELFETLERARRTPGPLGLGLPSAAPLSL